MTLTTSKYTIANYDKTMTNVIWRRNSNHPFLKSRFKQRKKIYGVGLRVKFLGFC
jgi:hypothetical protein